MKKTVSWVFAFTLTLLSLMGTNANASWFIDSNKFLRSVHGATSCTECHSSVEESDLHPDPSGVNNLRSDRFDAENCLMCHEEVAETLEEGTHGAETVEDPAAYENCIECHDPHYQEPLGSEVVLPELADVSDLSEDDAACMVCHARPDLSHDRGIRILNELCLNCHGDSGTPAQDLTGEQIPLIHTENYATVAHSQQACTDCHLNATRFPHNEKKLSSCMECHPRHDEKVARAAHFGISCEACHLKGVTAVKDPKSGEIGWKTERDIKAGSQIHNMAQADTDEACQRCHHPGNTLGAAAMVLPAKSLLCMPCHAATFSAGDTTTVFSLAIFVFGMIMTFAYLLTGTLSTQEEEAEENAFHKLFTLVGRAMGSLFSGRVIPIFSALFFDVLLQRRLYRRSPRRWIIHGLIFYPFAFRFLWGIVALVASLWAPGWSGVWAMLDKNDPATAFLFDVSGIMIMIGIVAAFHRGAQPKETPIPGLPPQDRIALALIAGIVLVGFFLEGMRITMTGSPAGSASAFLGYGLSRLFSSGAGLNEWYGYTWYLHALLTGGFIAYLPFSRLAHMILAPVSLAMGAVAEHEHKTVTS